MYADTPTDRQAESATGRLDKLLFAGVPERCVSEDPNWHLGYRLANHLKHHRSQRPYQLPQGVTYYDHLQRLGLEVPEDVIQREPPD